MSRGVIQLGAGPIQRELMRRIVAAGLVPIIVDRAENPAGGVPGSVHIQAPIDDPAAILAQLREGLGTLEVGAVLTSTDLGVASVPVVAEALGLPHARLASIESMDDKDRAKTILSRAGVDVPRGWLGRSRSDITLPGGEAEYVVKPVDSSGSRGVARVRDQAALEEAITVALEFSDRFLVEECIEGEHLDINGFVLEGRFELVSVAQRFFTPAPACVPLYGGIDAASERDRSERIARTLQASVSAFGYDHGPVKADIIDSDRGLVVLELAARFHGDVLSHHVADAAGEAPAALQWLARLGLCSLPVERPHPAAWFAVFADRAGEIASIDGLDAFRASKGFRRWIPRLAPGDRVLGPSDNRALVGFGLIETGSDRDLWTEARRLREGIHVSIV